MESLELHYDSTICGSVARRGVVGVDRVLVLVEDKSPGILRRSHPEGHFTSGAFEQLKEKFGSKFLSECPHGTLRCKVREVPDF